MASSAKWPFDADDENASETPLLWSIKWQNGAEKDQKQKHVEKAAKDRAAQGEVVAKKATLPLSPSAPPPGTQAKGRWHSSAYTPRVQRPRHRGLWRHTH